MFRPIYLDNQATTPTDPRVVTAMLPYLSERYGNPASTSHVYGWEAAAAVQQAREQVAQAIGAIPEEIIFTSGATEANNLAIKGVAEAYFAKGKHFITVQTEHNAVLDPFRYLESAGFAVTYLPVDQNGLVDINTLEKEIRADTIMISVMAANNEIGVLQPLATIGSICKDRSILFHSDGAQGIGKVPLDVDKMGIDLLALTAHKCYGPKGIGALYLRRRQPRVHIAPQIHGGGQERGLRSGTLYPPQIVGMATAIGLSLAVLSTEQAYLAGLRDHLWQKITTLGGIYRNGHPLQCLPGTLNISIEGVDGNALLLDLQPHMAISAGAACSSAHRRPSHVLSALGRSDDLALASVRFGIGRFNTLEEIDRVGDIFITAVQEIRKRTA